MQELPGMPNWQKAVKCTSLNNCLEILIADKQIFLRNSLEPDSVIFIEKESWDNFIEGVKNGKYKEEVDGN